MSVQCVWRPWQMKNQTKKSLAWYSTDELDDLRGPNQAQWFSVILCMMSSKKLLYSDTRLKSLIYCRKIKAWKAVCLLRAWSLDWDIWFKYLLQELGGACWVKHSCQKEVSKIQAGKWGTHVVRSVAWGEVWVEIPSKISVIRGPWGREGNPWTPDFLLRQFSVERDV